MKIRILVVLVLFLNISVQANNKSTLDTITVTTSRTEIAARIAPSTVTIISQEEIRKKGSENLLDAIRGTPGVSLRGVGTGGRKTISLRGMASKHTLILVDSKRISSTNDSFGPNTDYQYDWIPVDQIERIEVVRGPMSVLYGSDALGGVINIITKNTSTHWEGDSKIAGRITDSDIGGDGHHFEAGLSGPLTSNLQMGLNLQQSRRSAINSTQTPEITLIEGRNKTQMLLDLDWQPKTDQEVKLEYSTGQEDRWQDTLTRRGDPYQSRYDLERTQASLSWDGQIKQVETSFRVYQNTVDVVNTATNGVSPTDPQKIKDSIFEVKAGFSLLDKQFLTMGAEHHNESFKHPKLATGEDEVTIKSAYIQDEVDITDQIHLTAGIRYDDHNLFGSETSPRLSVAYNLSDQATIRASYGHGFRAPAIKQIAPGYSFAAGPFVIISNPEIKPETNDSVELGGNFSNDNLTVNLTFFNNEVQDLIETRFNRMLGGPIQEWIYDNIDEATIRGTEISTTINIESLDFNTSYQYLDAKDGNNERLQRQPRHTLSMGIDWQINGWKMSLWAEHQADQVAIPPRETSLVKLPDYTLWNTSLRKSLGNHLEFSFGLENIADLRLEDESPNFRHEEYPRTLRLEIRGKF